ncbi:hypothetical protein T8K17_18080 [Thalassobaculum sp. OXR-137]|uniref:hypothetical protein n=1 Tax=Thalassobaculum sp. OXR-137 TaxID=3100173 RepID=UPI002AC912D3|nr:hypothetical protein [Thalassobaculum sp. OXR-137]WPZ33140.1 hypothetical protein T8K17_18080 [Thalassobaculum sp. OXR-137]
MINRTSPTITRRQALAGLAVPAIAGSTGAAAALSHPDAELLALCETAHAERKACNDAPSDEAGDPHYDRACEATDALMEITPQTSAGFAAKLRALGEDEKAADAAVMRRLIHDAYAVAGGVVPEPLTPNLDGAIEFAKQLAEEIRVAAAQRKAERQAQEQERLALAQESSEDRIRRFLAEAVRS